MEQQRGTGIDTHRYFRTKYYKLREQFTALRNCYYLIECAWCKKRIRWQRKTAAVPGDTSHGICPACATDLFSKMQAMKDALAGALRPTAQSVATTQERPSERAGEESTMRRHEQRHRKSFLCLLTEDIQQRAHATRVEARDAQQRAQELRQLSQLTRHMRQAA